MSTTLLLALICAGGVLLFFIGISRTPTTNTAQMVQQRLSVYGGEKPLTVEEIELQRPFSERVLRPAIERLGSLLSRSTPQKARQDVLNRLELAGRPGNLTPEDFMAVRLVAAAVFAAIGLLLGLLLGNVVYLVISLVLGTIGPRIKNPEKVLLPQQPAPDVWVAVPVTVKFSPAKIVPARANSGSRRASPCSCSHPPAAGPR